MGATRSAKGEGKATGRGSAAGTGGEARATRSGKATGTVTVAVTAKGGGTATRRGSAMTTAKATRKPTTATGKSSRTATGTAGTGASASAARKRKRAGDADGPPQGAPTVLVLTEAGQQGADSAEFVRRLTDLGLTVVEAASDALSFRGGPLLRDAELVTGGRRPVALPPSAPRPDIVLEYPAPRAGSAVAKAFPGAVLCRPPDSLLADTRDLLTLLGPRTAALRRAALWPDQADARCVVFRDRERHALAVVPVAGGAGHAPVVSHVREVPVPGDLGDVSKVGIEPGVGHVGAVSAEPVVGHVGAASAEPGVGRASDVNIEPVVPVVGHVGAASAEPGVGHVSAVAVEPVRGHASDVSIVPVEPVRGHAPDGWRARLAPLLADGCPVEATPVAVVLGAPHVVRLLVTLDPAASVVDVHAEAATRAVPALEGTAGAAEVFAALARQTAPGGVKWRPVPAEEVPPGARRVAAEVGQALLDRPDLTCGADSGRLLPVAAVHVLCDGTPSRPPVLDVRWVTVAVEAPDQGGALEGWLTTALARRPRRPAPLLRLPRPATDDPTTAADVHPLAPLFPTLGDETGLVATRPHQGAQVLHLDPDLVGPDGSHDEDALTACLARSTDLRAPLTSTGETRFVEPGVGRTYLVGGVRLSGRPELLDFAVTGGGLTPYSAGGFVSVGSPITGRTALVRARHRQSCAARLERAGGRTSAVLAVIGLPDESLRMPDGTLSPAAMILRGFRSLFRVRQLDPVAPFYQSLQHASVLGTALLPPHLDVGLAAEHSPEALLRALDTYADGFDDVRRVLWPRPAADAADEAARAIRRALVAAYAPVLLDVVRRRLAVELGRDPDADPVHTSEYVAWFAATMGRQLALWHGLRFLHDYHQPGLSRPSGLVTLVESNVTLLAEFPDLDTAIFVDDAADAAALQLTPRDVAVLRAGFEHFHAREVESARAVVRTLSLAVSGCDTSTAGWADALFTDAYTTARGAA
ncbi:hypothetical protein AB0M29_03940 [Streptomyces sp. NPDC051976]|uniref:hypothetical protein n=1 Tax=Streptomyces sp. NPDC051976 TaxID=3154947 RepID=UPI003437B2F1